MSKIRPWLLAALLPLAALPAPAADEYANVHTIGIVSAVGGEFVVKRLGTMIFGNSETKLPIPSWGLDPWLTAAIAKALSPRFATKAVTAPDPSRIDNCNDFEECIAQLPRDPSIDAYLLVRETSFYARGGNLDAHGIGLYQAENPFGDDLNTLHTLYFVQVIDAKTAKVIDYGTAKLPETVFLGDHPYPMKPIKPALLPNSDAQLSATQLESLRPQVMELLQRSYRRALIAAGLLSEGTDETSGAGVDGPATH